ncbi:membrane-binding protein [Leptospira ellisii]|uniref:Membrane-binding protein n=1 Tax=Leptospira ellisii TaxID=2023197 RepID=A0A2N0BGF4_9LEPT|nr:membrane-binding protein [Leptospira ellisii]MDV6237890.1 membrane-binding protein [Leptospira ellisii]PJZ91074.1 membrane-binding protein [Leptospira ellisii]PKA03077.1 membrane-binding protein [Leptospira ellisii]
MKIGKFVILFLFFSNSIFSEPPRPANVPRAAQYDEKQNLFVLKERDGEIQKETQWDIQGVLESETYSIGELDDYTNYIKGRWYSRKQYYGFSITKGKELPPREKPSPIPKEAEFNFEFRKWELGELKDGKKEGVWKLWWPSGESAGTVEYKNGQYDGKLHMIWENGKTQEICMYVSGKRNGEQLIYHESGNLNEKVKYVNGLEEEDWLKYFDSGDLQYKVSFSKGIALMQERYENGKLKERKYYNKDKKVIKHEKF